MKSLKELMPRIITDFKTALSHCAEGEPSGFTLQAEDGRRLCVYVVPAEYETDIDSVIAARAGHATICRIKPIGEYE